MSDNKTYDQLVDEVYYVDLNDFGAFLSYADIKKLNGNTREIPRFSKERDPKKQGLLNSGRSATENRLLAARAYAHMLQVGETKACLAAGRWLAREVSTSSYAYERSIRRSLRGVTDEDELVESTLARPAYCSPPCKRPTDLQMKQWSFGLRTVTEFVMKKIAGVANALDEGWVPVCTGSRCLGFDDGDYDIVIYNKLPGMSEDRLIRDLSNLSSKARTRLHPLKTGTLLQIFEVYTPKGFVDVDCVVSKEGEAAHARIAQQGLFLERILIKNNFLPLFSDIKALAKSHGVVDSTSGFMNSYSLILCILEYLVLDRYITLDLSRPLFDQEPVCMNISATEIPYLSRNFFVWLGAKMADPDYVFCSFEAEPGCLRGKSEYNVSIQTRVCRDPFAFTVDNPMRSIQASRIRELILNIKHSEYCRDFKRHVVLATPLLDRRSGYDTQTSVDALVVQVPDAKCSITLVKGVPQEIFVFVATPRWSYGVGKTEVVARSRCALNQLQVIKEGTLLCWGISIVEEYGSMGLSVTDAIEQRDRLYYTVEEDGMWCVGLCENDSSISQDPMEPITIPLFEVLLQYIGSSHLRLIPHGEGTTTVGIEAGAERGGVSYMVKNLDSPYTMVSKEEEESESD